MKDKLETLANKWDDESDSFLYGGDLGVRVTLTRCAEELREVLKNENTNTY